MAFKGNGGMKIKTSSLIMVYWCMVFCASFALAAQEGTQAPGFGLRDLTGGSITLEQFKGKVVFLAFWAPWCIPCRDELPEIDRLYKKYRDEGFMVVGITEDASPQAIAAFLKKVPVLFPLVLDQDNEVADAYRLSHLPTGYLIGRDGIIRHRYPGFTRDAVPLYEKEITELLHQNNNNKQ